MTIKGNPQPHFTKQEIKRIREVLSADDRAIPIICIPPATRDDVIWAVRHPNRKRPSYALELKHELTAEEEEEMVKLIEHYRGTIKLLEGRRNDRICEM